MVTQPHLLGFNISDIRIALHWQRPAKYTRLAGNVRTLTARSTPTSPIKKQDQDAETEAYDPYGIEAAADDRG
ncbi:hypothetical protein GCM10025779_24580 [Arthrobacter cryoconiti]